jgi:hypothetical protein
MNTSIGILISLYTIPVFVLLMGFVLLFVISKPSVIAALDKAITGWRDQIWGTGATVEMRRIAPGLFRPSRRKAVIIGIFQVTLGIAGIIAITMTLVV